MADVIFEDFTTEVQGAIDNNIMVVLEECAGELEAATKRRSRVNTGQTKSSWRHKVTGSFLAGEFRAYIGSDDENAILEEFGTGEHAIQGGGRKGAWYVPVEGYTGRKAPSFNGQVIVVYGKGGKAYFKTNGKEARRSFYKAYEASKNKLIKKIQNSLKGL